jgi:hypothetical protein
VVGGDALAGIGSDEELDESILQVAPWVLYPSRRGLLGKNVGRGRSWKRRPCTEHSAAKPAAVVVIRLGRRHHAKRSKPLRDDRTTTFAGSHGEQPSVELAGS